MLFALFNLVARLGVMYGHDACADLHGTENKVRCNGVKPACDRCKAQAAECVYSLAIPSSTDGPRFRPRTNADSLKGKKDNRRRHREMTERPRNLASHRHTISGDSPAPYPTFDFLADRQWKSFSADAYSLQGFDDSVIPISDEQKITQSPVESLVMDPCNSGSSSCYDPVFDLVDLDAGTMELDNPASTSGFQHGESTDSSEYLVIDEKSVLEFFSSGPENAPPAVPLSLMTRVDTHTHPASSPQSSPQSVLAAGDSSPPTTPTGSWKTPELEPLTPPYSATPGSVPTLPCQCLPILSGLLRQLDQHLQQSPRPSPPPDAHGPSRGRGRSRARRAGPASELAWQRETCNKCARVLQCPQCVADTDVVTLLILACDKLVLLAHQALGGYHLPAQSPGAGVSAVLDLADGGGQCLGGAALFVGDYRLDAAEEQHAILRQLFGFQVRKVIALVRVVKETAGVGPSQAQKAMVGNVERQAARLHEALEEACGWKAALE